jgi:hypothetical protein
MLTQCPRKTADMENDVAGKLAAVLAAHTPTSYADPAATPSPSALHIVRPFSSSPI